MRIFNTFWLKSPAKAGYLHWDIKHALGLNHTFYQTAQGCRILVYHGICKKDPFKFNTLFVTSRQFEKHLLYYRKYFNIISLYDYFDGKFDAHKLNICLTFDDGFANNYTYVLPLLEQLRVPATFFITAIRHTGQDILWNDFLNLAGLYGPRSFIFRNERYHKNKDKKYINEQAIPLSSCLREHGFDAKQEIMDMLRPLVPFGHMEQDREYWQQAKPEQIKTLSHSPYVSIGSHGYYHNDLSKINIFDAARELKESKKYLERLTQKKITSLAFPYGAYHKQIISAAKEAGYTQLLATDFLNEGDAKNPLLRERLTINPFISTANQLYATIHGKYR